MQYILYIGIPLIYFFLSKRKGISSKTVIGNLGFYFSSFKFYLMAVAISIIVIAISLLFFFIFPLEIADLQNAYYVDSIDDFSFFTFLMIFIKVLVYIAFGEELFFRGFIGGLLFRKFSFHLANILQTLIFLLPHFLLLLISPKLFPFLISITISGWLLGWLRYKSNSFWPGVLSHSIVNTISSILILTQI